MVPPGKATQMFLEEPMILITIITITVPVLLTVAFFTLAERHLMASMQRRLGPHTSGLGGVLQPF